MKSLAKSQRQLIAAVDLGSHKICCMIAETGARGASANGGGNGMGGIRLRGIGHQISAGVKAGAIVDLDAAEAAILNAVNAAEILADVTLDRVVMNVAAGGHASRIMRVSVSVSGRTVGDADVRRVLAQAAKVNGPGSRDVIHAIPIGYSIDDHRGIRDPRGMYGHRLGVNLHVVTASSSIVRNLVNCLGRCHLDPETLVATPIAAGHACLVEDEIDLGVTVIDMGAGATSYAVFFDGHCVFADSLPLGGRHVTNDLARGLSCPLSMAERIKTLHASAVATPARGDDPIDVPMVGEEDGDHVNQVPRSLLVGIVQPRVEEILELVRARLAESGFARLAGRRVVLTGGASQLQGMRELSQSVLEKQVRLGRPNRIRGLGEAHAGPEFSTCAGLLNYGLRQRAEAGTYLSVIDGGVEARGLVGRVGNWLRQNLS